MIRPDLFKIVMRRHAASVVLISLRIDSRMHFMTATSFTPVSLEPPLVLFCLHRNGDTHDLIRVGSAVGINLLSKDQEALSRRFASKGAERYEVSDLHLVPGPDGVPLLSKACASMEVKLIEKHKGEIILSLLVKSHGQLRSPTRRRSYTILANTLRSPELRPVEPLARKLRADNILI